MSNTDYICDTEKIAAFIEGDLETGERLALEAHMAQCDRCTSELQSQQLFMCELESALANAGDVSVPKNFAKVVAVRAESDMSGLRNASEHKKSAEALPDAGFGSVCVAWSHCHENGFC